MDPQLKDLLTQLCVDGPIRRAFEQVLGVLKDENLDKMRAAVRDNDSRQSLACLEIERLLRELPSEIKRILTTI